MAIFQGAQSVSNFQKDQLKVALLPEQKKLDFF